MGWNFIEEVRRHKSRSSPFLCGSSIYNVTNPSHDSDISNFKGSSTFKESALPVDQNVLSHGNFSLVRGSIHPTSQSNLTSLQYAVSGDKGLTDLPGISASDESPKTADPSNSQHENQMPKHSSGTQHYLDCFRRLSDKVCSFFYLLFLCTPCSSLC